MSKKAPLRKSTRSSKALDPARRVQYDSNLEELSGSLEELVSSLDPTAGTAGTMEERIRRAAVLAKVDEDPEEGPSTRPDQQLSGHLGPSLDSSITSSTIGDPGSVSVLDSSNPDVNLGGVNPEANLARKTAKVRSIREDQRSNPSRVAKGMDEAIGHRIGKRGPVKYVILQAHLFQRDAKGVFSPQEVKDMRAMWVADCWDNLTEIDPALTMEFFMKACPATATSKDLTDWIQRAHTNLQVKRAMQQCHSGVTPLDYINSLATRNHVSVSVPQSLLQELSGAIKLLTGISTTMDQYLAEFVAQMSDITTFAGELKSGQNDFLTSLENKNRQMIALANKTIGASDKNTGQSLSQRPRTKDLSLPAAASTSASTSSAHILTKKPTWQELLASSKRKK
nr:MAG: hypothetical protein [Mononegavirales sp.]